MTQPFFFALFFFFSLAVYAQKIPVALSSKADQPPAFELPGGKSAVFLFNDVKRGRLRLEACEVDPAFSILRQVEAPEAPARYKSFDYLCGALRDSVLHALFVADETGIWSVQLRLSDFSLRMQNVLLLGAKEQCLGGFEQAGTFYVLTRLVENRTKGLLSVHENPGMANAQTHTVPLEGALRLTSATYQPHIPDPTVEANPEMAARPDKIFFDTGHIWFTSVLKAKKSAAKAPEIEWSAFSLRDYSLRTEVIPFDDATTPFEEGQKAAHYVLDNKLFTLFCHSELMVLQVRDLERRHLLWEARVTASEDTMRIFNSPVILPGMGTLGIDRTYHSGKKFIPRFLKLDPFIQVRLDSGAYVLSLGGFQLIDSPGAGPVYMMGSPGVNTAFGRVPGMPGMWRGPGWGGSSERSANFYVVLQPSPTTLRPAPADKDIPAFVPSGIWYDNTFFGKISAQYAPISTIADGMFYLFGKYYYGCYVPRNDAYRLFPLVLQTQKKD